MFQRRYPELGFREFFAHAVRVMSISLFALVADYRQVWDRIFVDEVEFRSCLGYVSVNISDFIYNVITFSRFVRAVVVPFLREGDKLDVLDLLV